MLNYFINKININNAKYKIPHPIVHPKRVKDSLYLFSQNNIPARPKTSIAEITADIIKRRRIIIGA